MEPVAARETARQAAALHPEHRHTTATAQVQPDRAPLAPAVSLTESEEDQFRRLEEDILAAAAAAASAGSAAGPNKAAAAAAIIRHGRRDSRWQRRILAVAAFRMEGQRRRLFEEDILSVAASVCGDLGSDSGFYSLDESLLQSPQPRCHSQNAFDGPLAGGSDRRGYHGYGSSGGGGGGSGRWSAPVCAKSRLFTDEDEDVMSLIVGETPGTPS